jgi:probable rRNA maturation factor
MKNNLQLFISDEESFFEKNPTLLNRIEDVIKESLKEEKVPYDVEISLSIVTKEEIREINKEYRQIDKSTDVLSFPQLEPVENGIIDWSAIDKNRDIDLDTHLLMLGDIIICDEIAIDQAKEYGHSLEREVCFLVAHSMLHLLGYDHIKEEDSKIMEDKQDKILDQLGIFRVKG